MSPLLKAQSTDVAELEQQEEPGGSLVGSGPLKLSTGSMPAERLESVANSRHAKVSFKCSQPHQLAEFGSRRRFSGLGGFEVCGQELKRVALENDYKLLREVWLASICMAIAAN